jgi:hypothetical protein
MTDQPAAQTPRKSSAEQCRKWREANPERYKAGVAKANAERRADPVKWARKLEQNRQSNKRMREKRRAYDRARDPFKKAARVKVRHLIEEEKLTRGSCEVCGKPNADAHHEDYAKPLDIRWLCRQHHAEEHRVR